MAVAEAIQKSGKIIDTSGPSVRFLKEAGQETIVVVRLITPKSKRVDFVSFDYAGDRGGFLGLTVHLKKEEEGVKTVSLMSYPDKIAVINNKNTTLASTRFIPHTDFRASKILPGTAIDFSCLQLDCRNMFVFRLDEPDIRSTFLFPRQIEDPSKAKIDEIAKMISILTSQPAQAVVSERPMLVTQGYEPILGTLPSPFVK